MKKNQIIAEFLIIIICLPATIYCFLRGEYNYGIVYTIIFILFYICLILFIKIIRQSNILQSKDNHLLYSSFDIFILNFLDLFQWILPKKLREKVYTPSHMEIKYEYFYAMEKYDGKWERYGLMFCFGFRTLLLIMDSFRVLATDTAFGLLLRSLPNPIKRWWMS